MQTARSGLLSLSKSPTAHPRPPAVADRPDPLVLPSNFPSPELCNKCREPFAAEPTSRRSGLPRLVRGNGEVISLQLRIEITDEIKRIRLVGSNNRNVMKSFDGFFLLANIFVNEAEVVPGIRIARQLLCGFQQHLLREIRFLLA